MGRSVVSSCMDTAAVTGGVKAWLGDLIKVMV